MADSTSSSTSTTSATSGGASQIPRVPIREQMFDANGNLSRTWIYFFERLTKSGTSTTTTTTTTNVTSAPPAAAQPTTAAGPFQRTLLLKDTTVGNDIADHTVVYGASSGQSSTCQRVVGVLRKTITSDLKVQLNRWLNGKKSIIGIFTIPKATAVNTVLTFTSFSVSELPDLCVVSWDVLASDGSSDAAGISAWTLEWQ